MSNYYVYMKKGYYITSEDKKVILEPQNIIDVSNSNIIELVIPRGCKILYCWNNQLTELVVPNGCENIYCDYIPSIIDNTNGECEIKMYL